MMPPRQTRTSRLREQRAAATAALAAGLADGDVPTVDLRDLGERIRLFDAAIADLEGHGYGWLRTLASWGLIVAAIVSAGALIPMRSVSFSVSAVSGPLSVTTVRAGSFTGLASSGRIRIDGCGLLTTTDDALAAQVGKQAVDPVALSASSAGIDYLGFGANTVIAVAPGTKTVGISLRSPTEPITVKLQLSGDIVASLAAGSIHWKKTTAYADSITLSSSPTTSEQKVAFCELTLSRDAGGAMALTNLLPTNVRFVEPSPDGAGGAQYTSSLTRASVMLPATGDRVELGQGDSLELDGLQLERFDLSVGSEATVRLAGTARALVTRSGGVEHSLIPSVLEYVAHNHKVGTFWAALGLLWGMTGWMRLRRAT